MRWIRGIKVTGENLVSADVLLDTINPEPHKNSPRWKAFQAIKKSRPKPPPKRRNRDIESDRVAKLKADRL